MQVSLLRKAKLAMDGKLRETSIPTVATLPSNVLLYPTVGEIRAWRGSLSPSVVTVDIECAGPFLVCVGFLHIRTESYICVRFRVRGGAIYKPNEASERAECLFNLLADPTLLKVFHNGQAFDVPYLEDHGFVVNGFHSDTMLRAHVTYAEMPKRLEFLALTYTDLPMWKKMVSTDNEVEEK